ncbi:MAG: hypothetical protein VX475_08750 [Myxococcota bacterium]|nr:hypothetical protein [Myxococcota bacterium]
MKYFIDSNVANVPAPRPIPKRPAWRMSCAWAWSAEMAVAEKVNRSALAKIASLEEVAGAKWCMMGLINRVGIRTVCWEIKASLAKKLDSENLSKDKANKVPAPPWSVLVMAVIFTTRNRSATRKKVFVGGVGLKSNRFQAKR